MYEKKKEDIPRKIVPANAKQNGNRKKRTGEQMRLPELFLERMKELTGEEYGLWLDAYDKPPTQGIRINPVCSARREKHPAGGRSFGQRFSGCQ